MASCENVQSATISRGQQHRGCKVASEAGHHDPERVVSLPFVTSQKADRQRASEQEGGKCIYFSITFHLPS